MEISAEQISKLDKWSPSAWWTRTSRSAKLRGQIVKRLACCARSERLSKCGSAAKRRCLITRLRVRALGHTAYELTRQRKHYGGIVKFGEIVSARTPTTMKLRKLDQRWIMVVWAGEAEGSDEHIGLCHRRAWRFRAVRHEPGRSKVTPEVSGKPITTRSQRTSRP